MVKGHGRSSASSATRKKHQKKIAASLGIDLDPSSSVKSQPGKPKNKEKSGRGQKEGKKESRTKVYVPPVKPARTRPDPLDVGGLAGRLPPELVVVLRNVGKKAQATKIKALEELGSAWVERALRVSGRMGEIQQEGGQTFGTDVDAILSLVEMIPAWIHYIPPLFVHPSRRVRLSAISVQFNLLKIPEVRDQILFYLKEATASEEAESILGSWCVLAHDIDKAVASIGRESWDLFVRCSSTSTSTQVEQSVDESNGTHFLLDAVSKIVVFGFIQRIILDPQGVYTYLNPAPMSNAPTPAEISSSQILRPGGGAKGGRMGEQQRLAAAIAAARRAERTVSETDSGRSKMEEYDESESDRKARLRIGGLGGLRWILDNDGISDEGMRLLKNPLLWTVLHHAQKVPFLQSDDSKVDSMEGFGFGQPNVRKAGWALLMKLLETQKQHIPPLVKVLSSAVLRSAWVEHDTSVQGAMWQPLLTFVKEFSDCWVIETRCYGTFGVEDEDEEDGNEEVDRGEDHNQSQGVLMTSAETVKSSLAYQEFLQFLQLGCSGSPIQGYPTIVIVLSTIPSSIIASSGTETPLENLFTSIWAALDGRALSTLHRFATSAAFLSALLECVVFMARRSILDGKQMQDESTGTPSVFVDGDVATILEETRKLVREQFGKVWQELRSGRLKVEENVSARLVAQNLDALERIDSGFMNKYGEELGLRETAWTVVSNGLRDTTKTNPGLASSFLKVLFDCFKGDTLAKAAARELVFSCLREAVRRISKSQKKRDIDEEVKYLECMLEQFKETVFEDRYFTQHFGKLVRSETSILLESSSRFLFSYLTHRKNEEDVLALWHAILGVIVTNTHDTERVSKVAMKIIRVAQSGDLPNYLKPKSDELDEMVGHLLGDVLSGEPDADFDMVKAVLEVQDYFISGTGHANFLETITTAFNVRVELLIRPPKQDDFGLDLDLFRNLLELLDLVISQMNVGNLSMLEEVLANVFLFGYLVPECAAYGLDASSQPFVLARGIWKREIDVKKLSQEGVTGIIASVKVKIKDLLIDTQVRPSSEEILAVLASQEPKLSTSILNDFFPSSETFDNMLGRLSHNPIDSSLAAIDPLLPSNVEPSPRAPEHTDSRGFSSYARIVNALVRVFLEDRKIAKQNFWALRHFIAISIYASDYQKLPACISPAFNTKALLELGELILRVQQITVYLFLGSLSTAQDGWRQTIIRRIRENQHDESSGTQLEVFVEDVIRAAVENDRLLDTRVLRVVLENILEDLEQQEAEEWVGLAKKLEKSAPQTSMNIISSVTETKAEPSGLHRYRNEQAAELLGIKPTKINTVGLFTLRKLAASAPNLESDIVFLPQPRAVNVVKACQGWVASDDVELDEEVESAMTLIFTYLVPILQNVPGSHWDFIWDVLENNLENSSITDDNTHTTLIRSLRLVMITEDVVKTNKSLRAEWERRRKNVLEMVRGVAMVKLDSVSPSLPRTICRELVLSILRELPESLIDENTLPKMCHLVTDHSLEVQKLGYGILRTTTKKYTEHLVIEAGVDTESTVKATLPSELVGIVQRHIDLSNLHDDEEYQNVFGSLLGWMLIFDLFQDASFKVNSGYTEQLRNLELISNNFIPLFLALLDLEAGPEKFFKLNVWDISDFYVDLFELGSSVSIHLLAAHLYYRALLSIPALIFSWFSNCKDRQLSTTITSYTSQYFSPVIIDVELAHVKGPAVRELADDNMSIKVAAVVNEVMASYLVDEHQLEIKFKIPLDWPLHKIEVKDVKRVGVDNDRWRAWILAVQQTIWSHNGRIFDGLNLFKRNVTLHFEGQVECAICYSIISVMDGSLPKKPCRTCKNKFHAVCLFKWFHTSNASTCPLCRSEIILA